MKRHYKILLYTARGEQYTLGEYVTARPREILYRTICRLQAANPAEYHDPGITIRHSAAAIPDIHFAIMQKSVVSIVATA